MSYDKFLTQKRIKKENELKILRAFNESPKRFTDLLKITNLSQMGLTNILKRMEKEGLIMRVIYNNQEAYDLSKKGIKYLKATWNLLSLIYEMQDKTSSYQGYSSGLNGVFWYIIRENEAPILFYNNEIESISKILLKKILNEFEKDKIKSGNMKGKHLIAFEIDFDIIRKNIDTVREGKHIDPFEETYKEIISDSITEFYKKHSGLYKMLDEPKNKDIKQKTTGKGNKARSENNKDVIS